MLFHQVKFLCTLYIWKISVTGLTYSIHILLSFIDESTSKNMLWVQTIDKCDIQLHGIDGDVWGEGSYFLYSHVKWDHQQALLWNAIIRHCCLRHCRYHSETGYKIWSDCHFGTQYSKDRDKANSHIPTMTSPSSCVCVCSGNPIFVETSVCLQSHLMGTSNLVGTKKQVPIIILNEYRCDSEGAYMVFSFGSKVMSTSQCVCVCGVHFCKAFFWKSVWIKTSAKWVNVNVSCGAPL